MLIVGFALVLAMAVAMVVDVSAAYLQRQGLDTVADGAALRAADLGATGEEVYGGGVPQGRLDLSVERIRGSVREFLAGSGAYASYPGLSFDVDVDPRPRPSPCTSPRRSTCRSPCPGSPEVAMIGATGSAVVVAER